MHKHKKKYGQNFLNDVNLSKKIVNSANLTNKNVVEIGPGKGFLTQFILPQAKKVLAYEIDITLSNFLIFENFNNFKIIYVDVLKRNFKVDFKTYFDDEQVVVVSNLPYYITTAIIFKCLQENQITSFVFMMQKEVGLRLLSVKNTKYYNALSVILQFLTTIKKITIVNKKMFYPIPKVDGIVLKFDKKLLDPTISVLKNNFIVFVKIAFKQKRKTLMNNLVIGYKIDKSKVMIFFNNYKISYHARAEELSIDNFIYISKLWYDFFIK